jgi:hypothetical protein
MNIIVYPDKDNVYQGRVKIEYINIHSNEELPEKKKKDMDEFFADYKKDARNVAQSMSLQDYKSRLMNRKELSTDGEIKGKFESLVATLSFMFEKSEFKVEGDSKKISFYRKNPLNENDDINLIITFPGKIIAHNSKNFEQQNGTMKWNLKKTGDKEISFTLESVE